VSDDNPSRAEQRLINAARRHQPAPAKPVGNVTRVGRFSGVFQNEYWLSQAWSPDGTQLAYGGRTAYGKGILQVWNGNSGHHETLSMRHLTHDITGAVISLAWSPDSKRLATVEENHASKERLVHIRGQAEGSRLSRFPLACRSRRSPGPRTARRSR
jgi:WD40 repeat protein